MLQVELISQEEMDPDAEGVYLMSRKEWLTNSVKQMFTPDDGTGYPIIRGVRETFKVYNHTVFPLDPKFDGVIWYAK